MMKYEVDDETTENSILHTLTAGKGYDLGIKINCFTAEHFVLQDFTKCSDFKFSG